MIRYERERPEIRPGEWSELFTTIEKAISESSYQIFHEEGIFPQGDTVHTAIMVPKDILVQFGKKRVVSRIIDFSPTVTPHDRLYTYSLLLREILRGSLDSTVDKGTTFQFTPRVNTPPLHTYLMSTEQIALSRDADKLSEIVIMGGPPEQWGRLSSTGLTKRYAQFKENIPDPLALTTAKAVHREDLRTAMNLATYIRKNHPVIRNTMKRYFQKPHWTETISQFVA